MKKLTFVLLIIVLIFDMSIPAFASSRSKENIPNRPSSTKASSEAPTEAPTEKPTVAPTVAPTEPVTEAPTVKPTVAPTEPVTEAPTVKPTVAPTEPVTAPTVKPTVAPTVAPTEPVTTPTVKPTVKPTISVLPEDPVPTVPSIEVIPKEPVSIHGIEVLSEEPVPIPQTGDDNSISLYVTAVLMSFILSVICFAHSKATAECKVEPSVNEVSCNVKRKNANIFVSKNIAKSIIPGYVKKFIMNVEHFVHFHNRE